MLTVLVAANDGLQIAYERSAPLLPLLLLLLDILPGPLARRRSCCGCSSRFGRSHHCPLLQWPTPHLSAKMIALTLRRLLFITHAMTFTTHESPRR